jgi:hypothetical protein
MLVTEMRYILILLAAGAAMAQTAPSLSGTWQAENDQSMKWVVAQTGDEVHIRESDGSAIKSDFTCAANGKECSVKDSGRAEKVSLWFNGQTLVELCTRGSDVVKRRFSLDSDGKTLEVEVLPIVPPGRTEKIAFTREQ